MSNEDSSSHTHPEIGRALERARVGRGLSYWQVEEATKIRARYLHDLERENFDVLPAVYVLGSLKTYADYLGLDGEAMVLELKNRQAPPQEERDPTDEEPVRSASAGFLASLGALLGFGGRGTAGDDEDDSAPATVPGRGPRLYWGLGAALILILTVALASSFGGGGQPAVSQVREPATSEVPSRIAFSSDLQDERNTERSQDTESADNRPEKQAKAQDEKDQEQSDEQGDQDDARPAEDTGDGAVTLSAPATASTSGTASASPTPVGTASASASSTASATSTPVATAPASALSAATERAPATAAPETANPGAAPVPTAAEPARAPVQPAPVATSTPDGSRPAEEGGGLDASRLSNDIFGKVRNATDFAR